MLLSFKQLEGTNEPQKKKNLLSDVHYYLILGFFAVVVARNQLKKEDCAVCFFVPARHQRSHHKRWDVCYEMRLGSSTDSPAWQQKYSNLQRRSLVWFKIELNKSLRKVQAAIKKKEWKKFMHNSKFVCKSNRPLSKLVLDRKPHTSAVVSPTADCAIISVSTLRDSSTKVSLRHDTVSRLENRERDKLLLPLRLCNRAAAKTSAKPKLI